MQTLATRFVLLLSNYKGSPRDHRLFPAMMSHRTGRISLKLWRHICIKILVIFNFEIWPRTFNRALIQKTCF